MKKQLLQLIQLPLLLGILITSVSCNNEDDDKAEATPQCAADYVISNVTGAFPSVTSYVQTFGDLNVSSLNTTNATEIPKASFIWKYDDSGIYVSGFGAPATMVKYTVDENCVPREKELMVVPGANTFSSVEFISPTKAYATVGGGLAKVVVFDPSTMRVSGEVDLEKVKKPNATQMYYVGSTVRENRLFLAVAYFDANFSPAFDSCHIAVINTETNKLEKVISDKRTGHILANGPAVSCFTKDANGDIYVQGMGYSHSPNGRTVPSGILRIKNGETNFDPDYFFDLKQATGKDCYGLYHFGNALTFTTRIEDDSKFWSASVCKLYKIDLANKISTGEVNGVPAMKGSASSLMRKFDDQSIYFNVQGESENAMYEYKIQTGTAAKKFTMVGSCNGFEKKTTN